MTVILTTALILLCFVIVLLILIQRTSGGMGSALGGGAADQVLGAGSAAQLTKLTVYGIGGFFVLAFALYALYQSQAGEGDTLLRTGGETPELSPNPGVIDTTPVAPPPAPSPADNVPVPPPPAPSEVPPAPEVPAVPAPSDGAAPASEANASK